MTHKRAIIIARPSLCHHGRSVISASLAVGLLLGACGGGANQVSGLVAEVSTSLIGDNERRAVELTEGMTDALLSGETPHDSLSALERFCNENRAEMLAVSGEISAKAKALEGDDRRDYEEALAALTQESAFRWEDVRTGFVATNPEHEADLTEILTLANTR